MDNRRLIKRIKILKNNYFEGLAKYYNQFTLKRETIYLVKPLITEKLSLFMTLIK